LANQQLKDTTKETLEILTNREIIAINQDPVFGTGITPFRWGVNVRAFFFSLGFNLTTLVHSLHL
jgi:hypothetical protein